MLWQVSGNEANEGSEQAQRRGTDRDRIGDIAFRLDVLPLVWC